MEQDRKGKARVRAGVWALAAAEKEREKVAAKAAVREKAAAREKVKAAVRAKEGGVDSG